MPLAREADMPSELIELIRLRTSKYNVGDLSKIDNCSAALVANLFGWGHTPEGVEFWSNVDSFQCASDRAVKLPSMNMIYVIRIE